MGRPKACPFQQAAVEDASGKVSWGVVDSLTAGAANCVDLQEFDRTMWAAQLRLLGGMAS